MGNNTNTLNHDESKKLITVHRSFFFRMVNVPANPTITTHNIAQDWDNDRIEALEAAVHRLVDRNPILSGVLHDCSKLEDEGTTKKRVRGIYAEPRKGEQTCVHYVPAPSGIPSPAMLDRNDSVALTNYVQTYIEPHIPRSKKGSEEIANKLPIFGVHIMRLPDGHVYYAPRLSHVVGDGTTYYQLLEELNAILYCKKLPPPIIWESDGATSFDLISTHQLRQPSFWLGLIIAGIVHAIFGFPKTQTIILSKLKIDRKKKELAKVGSYLSTNDIVSAALSAAVSKDYDYSIHAVNYRSGGRCPGVGPRDGGNVTRLVPYRAAAAHDPNQVREQTDSLAENPNRDTPLWSMLKGRGYNQTNWANLQQVLDGTIFHSPSKSLVDEIDIPLAVFYQPNEKQVGILHKFKNVNQRVGLLSEIIE